MVLTARGSVRQHKEERQLAWPHVYRTATYVANGASAAAMSTLGRKRRLAGVHAHMHGDITSRKSEPHARWVRCVLVRASWSVISRRGASSAALGTSQGVRGSHQGLRDTSLGPSGRKAHQ